MTLYIVALEFYCRLLASGLMEYNTDWKLIQQCFLPCKSKHQVTCDMDFLYSLKSKMKF